ncbi:MAG: TAXI family TRAP transporter solute-binding subunit [Beijerinckiaceae bacterium]|nr:TAXI family TRAP transporter solute-binding subunit [Beijerinckiaceae bacterium]
MKKHIALRWTALLFALAAAGLAAWYIVTAPKTLKIAAGPEGSMQIRFLQSLARSLVEHRESVRLEIVTTPDSPSAAKALESGKVELALLRSDDPTSTEARSIVVIQKRHVFLVARQDRVVKDWADLRSRRLGIVRGDSDNNRPLVERVLAQYGVDAGEVSLQEIAMQGTTDALASGAVDALVFVGFPGARLRQVLMQVTQGRGTPIAVIGVSNAGALAFRYRDLETTQLPAGVFSGSPPLPPTTIETIAITHEITATSDLDESVATNLTRTLIEAATRIRRLENTAFNVEAPPVDRPRRYQPHAGTAAFVNDEVTGFLDTYSEYIWFLLFGLSIVGSSITGFLGWAGLRQEAEKPDVQHILPALLDRLEIAHTAEDVDRIEEEFDVLVKLLIRNYVRSGLENGAGGDPEPMIRMFERLVDRQRARLAALQFAAQ